MTINILLVDDTKTVLIAQKMMLAKTGFKVSVAESGIEALEKMDKCRPDLILLDMLMPKMNGIEFCKRVRNNDRFSDIPIIAVTTKGDEEMRNMAYAAGCNDFMTKPFGRMELLAKIRTLSARKTKQAEEEV